MAAYFLFGFLLIVLAFWAGTQPNALLGLLGFLGFFVVGVTLIVEGFKKKRSGNQGLLSVVFPSGRGGYLRKLPSRRN